MSYDEAFYANAIKSKWWMIGFGEALVKQYNIKTILDLGCGVGYILEGCYANGASVCGVDLSYEAAKKYIPADIESFIHYADLTQPLKRGRFGIAMSIETAEHLPEDKADAFVDNLINASDTILFTAAIVGQKGENHINTQPREYWIKKFEDKGYAYSQEDVNICKGLLSGLNINNRYLRVVSRNLMFFRRR